MAVSQLPGQVVGSRGCCGVGQSCSGAATPPSVPWLRPSCRKLAVEQLVAKRAVEALVVTVLPWRARRNVERLHADLAKSGLDGGGNQLAAVAHWEALAGMARRPPGAGSVPVLM